MVVIADDNLHPYEWRLGRVVKIYAGGDKNTRVVDIRTQRGIVTRPIVKLVILPAA